MSLKKIRIATRKSPLALWQAEHVKTRLMQNYPGLEIELVSMQTQGDRILDTPLSMVGGKGLFIKELEQALYDHKADIAVHSMKDVTIDMPDGLLLPVILKRENPLDVFIWHCLRKLDVPTIAPSGKSFIFLYFVEINTSSGFSRFRITGKSSPSGISTVTSFME